MENKKEYSAPEIKVVELKRQSPILTETSTTDDFGLAPHEQDPIA